MTHSFDCKIYNVENGFFMNHPVDTSEKNYLLDFSNKNSFDFVFQHAFLNLMTQINNHIFCIRNLLTFY